MIILCEFITGNLLYGSQHFEENFNQACAGMPTLLLYKDGRTVTQPISTLNSLLFSGDQLTAARIRGAQEGKCNSVTASKQFEGLIPVIEDWHTKVIVPEVSL